MKFYLGKNNFSHKNRHWMKILAIINTNLKLSRQLLLCNTEKDEINILGKTKIPIIDCVILNEIIYGLDESGDLWEISIYSKKLKFSHRAQLPPDSFGNPPRWLVVKNNLILAGGDGLKNQSIYIIQILNRKIKIDRMNMIKGYQDLKNKFENKNSIEFISAAITPDATYYLATNHSDSIDNSRYLLYRDSSHTTCQTITSELGYLEAIYAHGSNMYGFFSILNGFYYGKITSRGLVTKYPTKIYFGSTSSTSSHSSHSSRSSTGSSSRESLKSSDSLESSGSNEYLNNSNILSEESKETPAKLICAIILDQAQSKFSDN